MRLKSINDRMNTCSDCGFTALFMYKDAANCPLCPKCSAAEIKAFKESIRDIQDSLEFNDESAGENELDELYNEEEVTELKF